MTSDILCLDITVVRQIQAAIQTGTQRQLLRMIQTGIIEYQSIKFISRLKAADFAEEAAAADGGNVECLIDAQGLNALVTQTPAEFGGANGGSDGIEHIFGFAAGNVRSQTNVDVVCKVFGNWRNAGGDIGIGERGVGDKNAVFLDEIQFFFAGMDAVRHDAGMVAAE